MGKLIGMHIDANFVESNVTVIKENIFSLDGYSAGGRTLEGVMFDIKIDDSGEILSIDCRDSFKSYFKTLNEKYWIVLIRRDAMYVLKEGDEVEVPEFIANKYPNLNLFVIE